MKKDMFDLFRESEHKLEQRPSSSAWQRLETRLDNQKRPRRFNFFPKIMSIAAVILLLITVGLAILLQQNGTYSTLMASTKTPTIFEDLSAYRTTSEEPLRVMEFTHKHIVRLANPIEEGSIKKKLLPKTK